MVIILVMNIFFVLFLCVFLPLVKMLKILQPRPQQYVNFQMFKLVLEKAEEPKI